MTWQEINNSRLPFIRMGENLFKRMYGEIRRNYIASLKDLTTPEQIIEASRNVIISEEMVRMDFERFYVKTGIAFAKKMQKGFEGGIEIKQDEDDWLAEVIEYVRSKTGAKITSTIRFHYKDIERITRQLVEMGIDKGWGMNKIALEISRTQGRMDLWKALRIARTEVVPASNMGTKIGAENLPGNKEKVWISTIDDRSRGANISDKYDHLAMNEVRVAFNEKFVTPNNNYLEFPGDPECEDPGETINCRCGYEVLIIPEY